MKLRIDSPLEEDLEELIRRVIGAAIEVHKKLGPGFLESVYEKALCRELGLLDIAFDRQKPVAVEYKGLDIEGQRLDLVVEGKLILELKAVEGFAPIHEAQLLSYMKAARIRAGLLVNFNVKQLKDGIRRMVL